MRLNATLKRKLLLFFIGWHLFLRVPQLLLSLFPWPEKFSDVFLNWAIFNAPSFGAPFTIALNIFSVILLLILALLLINKPKSRKALLFFGLLISLLLAYQVIDSYRYYSLTSLKEAGVTFLFFRPLLVFFWQLGILPLSLNLTLLKNPKNIKEIVVNMARTSLILWLVVNIVIFILYHPDCVKL